MLNEFNERLKYYEVQASDNFSILCEDGEYHKRPGYVMVNKENGYIERTSLVLPDILWQAEHFDAMLTSVLSNRTVEKALVDMPVEDVLAN